MRTTILVALLFVVCGAQPPEPDQAVAIDDILRKPVSSDVRELAQHMAKQKLEALADGTQTDTTGNFDSWESTVSFYEKSLQTMLKDPALKPQFDAALAQAKASGLNRKRSVELPHLGANGNFKHCESGREVSQLSVDAFPDLSVVHPLVSLRLDELVGELHFSVEVPYLPFDARYVVSFEPLEHTLEQPQHCASNYDTEFQKLQHGASLTPSAKWGHAPNANHQHAFESPDRYGAYYQSPDSPWTVRASGCSHVTYEASFDSSKMLSCADSDGEHSIGVSKQSADLLTLTGSLVVGILRPSSSGDLDEAGWGDAEIVATWLHPFSVSIDSADSKISLLDSANGGLRRKIQHGPARATSDRWHENALQRVETVLRKAEVDSQGLLHIVLQTAIYDLPNSDHKHPRNMTLAHISRHKHHAEFSLRHEPVERDNDPYCIDSDSGLHKLTVQNWHLVSSGSAHSAFDGDFLLLFCDDKLVGECDESEAMHRTTLGVRVSNPLSFDDSRMAFHSEITQHRQTAGDSLEPLDNALSGDRVCMQTYVIGPKKLTSQLDVELLGAWLCTDDSYDSADGETSLQCADRDHSLQLATDDDQMSQQLIGYKRLNVTVQHPGLYGMMSVGVCFNVDARFTDEKQRSVINTRQRYESQIRIKTASLRKQGAVVLAKMFEQLRGLVDGRQYDDAVSDKLAHTEAQNQQTTGFSSAHFDKALRHARSDGLTHEEHAHRFAIHPRAEDLYSVSDAQASVAIIIIAVSILCALCGAIAVLWRREKLTTPIYGLQPTAGSALY